ncbi:MAG: helix-turn-helix domain-containing protein [Deltaproteobacteria bacterium]|nr:helix-turn-helix domain-containing protein [Deltaproteobacteria bacterium]
MPAKYLTTQQAAEYLSITLSALRMSIHRGHIKPTGRIGNRLLFSTEDLDEQIRENLSGKPSAANDDVEAPNPSAQRPQQSTRNRTKRRPQTVGNIRSSVENARKKSAQSR